MPLLLPTLLQRSKKGASELALRDRRRAARFSGANACGIQTPVGVLDTTAPCSGEPSHGNDARPEQPASWHETSSLAGANP